MSGASTDFSFLDKDRKIATIHSTWSEFFWTGQRLEVCYFASCLSPPRREGLEFASRGVEQAEIGVFIYLHRHLV